MDDVNPVTNVFESLEKPTLDDCYICFEPIGNGLKNGAIHPYRCRHHVSINCITTICRPTIRSSNVAPVVFVVPK